nr:mechanosensitive ion channel family protein [Gammaproteobacteria bacterium]
MDDKTQQVVQILRDLGLPSLLYLLSIMVVAWALTMLVRRGLPWLAQRSPAGMRLVILKWVPVLRLVILALTIVLIITLVLDPSLPNIVAVLGATALAIGFAFKDYVNGLIAGVVTVFEQPYRPGDWIRIDDAYGVVTAVNLRTVQIVTPDDTVVTIPHSKVWETNIYNANSGRRELLCVVNFHLHPLHDAMQVRQRLYDVALTSPYLQLERPITVIVSERPWDTHYEVKAYPIDAGQQFQFMTDITVRAKAALGDLGVQPATIPPPAMPPPVDGEALYPQHR